MASAPDSTVASVAPMPASRMELRFALLALGGIALLSGLLGGLVRLGWQLPVSSLAALHGPLLISGLFGTLIGLERAIALGRGWAFACPLAAGLGTLALIAGLPVSVGAALYVAAAAVLVAASLAVTVSQPALFHGTMLIGAAAWLTGDVLWLSGHPVPEIIGWWLAFPVLTIAGERLELSRVLAPRRGAEAIFLLSIGLLLAGAQNALQTANGAVLFGAALVAMTCWLLRHDLARRNVRAEGQTRFFAVCMLLGYVWLGTAGLLLLVLPEAGASFRYDIAVHLVLIGFAFSMIFGHALIILPAITRRRVRYHPRLYAPLILLQIGVAMRVLGGLLEQEAIRLWSGPVVLVAMAGLAITVIRGAMKPHRA